MEQFEVRLTAAYETSNNAQELCSQYQTQAKKILQQCKEQGEKLKQAESSLQSLQVSFIEQLELLLSIFKNIQRDYSFLERQENTQTSRQKKIYSDLANTFRKLKKQSMDPALAPSKKGSTLFHFVDVETVSALQRELESVLGRLTQRKNSAGLMVGELQGRIDEVKQMIKLLLKDRSFLDGILLWAKTSNSDSADEGEESLASRFVESHFHLIDADLKAITSILIALSSLTDRVGATKQRLLRSGEEDILGFQLQAIEGQVEQVPESVAKACDCLHRINQTYKKLSLQCSECNTPFLRSAQIKQRFEELVFAIETANEKVSTFERAYQEYQLNIEFYCTELENLSLWYELYYNGYHELLFEIQRREAESQRQTRLIEVIEKELQRMSEEETEKRKNFAAEHGQYLPPSLCPAINERAVHYSLSADIKPTLLPKLSKYYKREDHANLE